MNTAIVVGAGIVGLATARALAMRGYQVTVVERTHRPVGASIRNFGMVWPVGQPDGELRERALLSRSIWKQTCEEAGIWYEKTGSLHLAYRKEEWQVLEELADLYRHRGYQLLDSAKTLSRSPIVQAGGLLGSLWSPEEIIVDPRQVLERVPLWLTEKFGVRFIWGRAATDICYPAVYMGSDVTEADEIYVCSGADFETLYPEIYSEIPITRCKLQMMRLAPPAENLRIGPALCGGLSLLHYSSFRVAPSLAALQRVLQAEMKEYFGWGIHVMVSQNREGELTVGDSHEYGLTHDPFDREVVNQLILQYFRRFVRIQEERVIETWNGIYPRLTNGQTELVLRPEQGVTIINGLGGAGMTLSFGLCHQVVEQAQGTFSMNQHTYRLPE